MLEVEMTAMMMKTRLWKTLKDMATHLIPTKAELAVLDLGRRAEISERKVQEHGRVELMVGERRSISSHNEHLLRRRRSKKGDEVNVHVLLDRYGANELKNLGGYGSMDRS
jgi:hypothetical protein